MAAKNGFKGITKTWNKMARDAVEEAQDEVILAFAEKVTQPAPSQGVPGHTPVLEGILMANTRISYGSPDKGFSWNEKDPSGRKTFNALVRTSKNDVYLPIYLTNSTPYNTEAEFTGWKFTEPYKYFSTAVASSIEALNRYSR